MTSATKPIEVDAVAYDKFRKKKKWVVRYRDGHGKRRRASFAYRPEAVAFRKTLLAAARFSSEPAPLSLSHAIDRFVGSIVAPNRHKTFEAVLRLHVTPIFGDRWLHDIGADFFEEFEEHFVQLDIGYARARELRKALDGTLAFARDRGWLPPVISGLPKRLTTTTPSLIGRARRDRRKVVPTLEEVDSLLSGADALDGDAGWLRIPIYLALRAGLRIGEILALRWSDVDFNKRLIHVTSSEPMPNTRWDEKTQGRSPPKTRSGHRIVTMTQKMKSVLQWWRRQVVADRDCKVVFRPTWGNTVPLTRAKLSREFILFQEKIGMTERVRIHRPGNVTYTDFYPGHYSFHQLRHAHVAILIWSKVPNEQISASVGHKTVRITLDMYGYLIQMHREGAKAWPGGQGRPDLARDEPPSQRLVERHGRIYRTHLPSSPLPVCATHTMEAAA